jgi:DNA-binding FadR family transcriptional regulator
LVESTLHEALTSPSFIGLIRIHKGDGAYACEHPSKHTDRPWPGPGVLELEMDINDLSETRLVLETETARTEVLNVPRMKI